MTVCTSESLSSTQIYWVSSSAIFGPKRGQSLALFNSPLLVWIAWEHVSCQFTNMSPSCLKTLTIKFKLISIHKVVFCYRSLG